MIANDNDPVKQPPNALHIKNITSDWPSMFDSGEIPSRRKKLSVRMAEFGVTDEQLEAIYDRHFNDEILDGNFTITFPALADALNGDNESAWYFFYANNFRNHCNTYIDNLREVAKGDINPMDAIRMEKECKTRLAGELASLAFPQEDIVLQRPIDEFTRDIKNRLHNKTAGNL